MSKFNIENITTWGLEQDKRYGGYNLPVSFKYHPETVMEIEKVVKKQKTKDIFYGDSKTIYFRVFELTEKQKEELLDKGRKRIDIYFEINGVSKSEKTGLCYLRTRVLGLRKSEMVQDKAPKDEFKKYYLFYLYFR